MNPERYSYKAAQKLLAHKHDVYLIGNRPGELFDREITKEQLPYNDVDTVTMYVSAKNQKEYYDYITNLRPRRVIFNPGTENQDFAEHLESNGIIAEEACTLVLLATEVY